MPEKPNILIAVPAYGGSTKNACTTSLIALAEALIANGIKSRFVLSDMATIYEVRNFYGSIAIQDQGYTHVLFVDSDMGFEPRPVLRMAAEDKDVIGCACLLRKQERTFNVALSSKTVDVRNGMITVDAIGMALTLISRRAFVALSKHVRTQSAHSFHGLGLTGPLFGFFDSLQDGDVLLREDMSFCVRWRKLCGGLVHALIDESIKHVGEFQYQGRMIDHVTEATKITR